ncbi:Ubiquitin carboxyl-terminal hydrolase 14 [Armadillidium nasatum]|uniref:Ubiquitin carboxyl-terminal hydrolase n=1 Tax=Armadillidium nasatum TaxID=96803 RepID=A0A5N5SPV8_9CRUS|nr:Ubiquitin carboxyl-terminal hydrolase 14 [Armadillidium nasatum]
MVFKAQVFALTGVQPHRQKIMIKGSTIKPDAWEGIKLKDGSMILMMGSKDEDVPEEPTEKPTFVEDMTEDELNTAMELPVGIRNLGNTCYLNAVIQCLRSVPEIQDSIKKYEIKSDGSAIGGPMITVAIQDVFRFMDMGKTAIPIVFVDLFRTTFPRFAEVGEGGKYMQQDASECWTELFRLFQDVLPPKNKEKVDKKFSSSLVDQYFSGEFRCEWKCDESEEEEKQITYDRFQQLSCHISQEVKYLHTGLVARMKEQITKRSEKLDRDAVFTKSSKITRLPAYLSVEMIRFFYKEKEKVNAKILKDVKFPIILDVFDLCSEELQKKLIPYREKYKIMDDRLAEEEKDKKRGKFVDNKSKKLVTFPYSFPDDLGSSNSGFYELQAVLTHQGRSSSSGHYVAWVRFKGNEWLKCDDDQITPVSEEDILKLSGGGDWHIAYILLYGPRVLKLEESEVGEKEKEPVEEKMEVTNE